MGHTRLGATPKTRKWNDVVAQFAGEGPTRGHVTAAVDIEVIAAKALDAARNGLDRVVDDPGVRYTFYLLTQLALASRAPDWEAALGRHGIRLTSGSTVFDLTVEMQDAVDRHLRLYSTGATDLSEMAQQAAGEAIASIVGGRPESLFGRTSADVQGAMRSLSTRKGFGELGQRFFGRFIARFLNFYLSRVTADQLGKQRLRDLGDVAQFNDALRIHCDQSARIVRDFCGAWYSKTEFEQGINPRNSSALLAHAMHKLRSELERQIA